MTSLHQERMVRFAGAGLYLVTSGALSRGRSTVEIARAALAGGVKLIQLREKDLPLRRLMDLAGEIRQLTSEAGALLIVNDRIDVALSVGADGVHLGQDDLPVDAARRIAPDLIIGASTHSPDEALRAEADGASYINIGPLFPTGTKPDWTGACLGLEGLGAVSSAARGPFTVMGGIKRQHIPELVAAGARTIALVTAVTMADDPCTATRELLKTIRSTGQASV